LKEQSVELLFYNPNETELLSVSPGADTLPASWWFPLFFSLLLHLPFHLTPTLVPFLSLFPSTSLPTHFSAFSLFISSMSFLPSSLVPSHLLSFTEGLFSLFVLQPSLHLCCRSSIGRLPKPVSTETCPFLKNNPLHLL